MKKTVQDLERIIEDLEKRVRNLEARPVYVPYPVYPSPQPVPYRNPWESPWYVTSGETTAKPWPNTTIYCGPATSGYAQSATLTTTGDTGKA